MVVLSYVSFFFNAVLFFRIILRKKERKVAILNTPHLVNVRRVVALQILLVSNTGIIRSEIIHNKNDQLYNSSDCFKQCFPNKYSTTLSCIQRQDLLNSTCKMGRFLILSMLKQWLEVEGHTLQFKTLDFEHTKNQNKMDFVFILQYK